MDVVEDSENGVKVRVGPKRSSCSDVNFNAHTRQELDLEERGGVTNFNWGTCKDKQNNYVTVSLHHSYIMDVT